MKLQIINGIDRFTELTGRTLSWLTMLMVVLVVAIVVGRYFLGLGSIALQESVTYLHAMVFMLGLAFTLKRGGHVRVDIFYRNYSVRRRALVDLIGGILFLVPFCLFVFISCWDYVLASWAIAEGSSENDGIAAVYLLKTLMLIMPVTLLLQAIAELLKAQMILRGHSVQSDSTADAETFL
jgi:TRAP-type mannitol/chloroaromatic compound transport system permease small subunit